MQGNNNAFFTTNAAVIYPANIQIFHTDGRYKFTDGVTQLSALPFLAAPLNYTPEDVANKSTNVNTDQASNTKYPSVKAVYDWAISLFVKKGTITNNTILKGSGTDTATDSTIENQSNGRTTFNSAFDGAGIGQSNFDFNTSVGGLRETYNSITGTLKEYFTNGVKGAEIGEASGYYNLKVKTFFAIYTLNDNIARFFMDSSTGNFGFGSGGFTPAERVEIRDGKLRINDLTPSQIVETDASKNLVSVAKQSGYNLPLGTTAGTVLEGNRITQTITNGDTTHAPSGDVIHDILLTKADKQNGLVSGGAISVGTYGGTGTDNDIRVAAATWYISPSNYSTAGNTDFLDIVLAAAGLQRYVGFYGDNTNTITMVGGAESEYAVYPSTPVGKALIGYVLVTDSAAASTPDLSGYMLISNKATMGDTLLAVNDSKYVTPLALSNFSRRLGYKFLTTIVPNTTNIEILHSYPVNGIANVAGRTLDLFMSTRQTSDSNTKTWRVYFNTTNDLTGAVLVATLVVTTNGAYFPFQRFFHLVNNTTIFPESTASASHPTAYSSNTSASPANITVPNMNNNFYILITCQKQLNTNTVAMDRTTLDLK